MNKLQQVKFESLYRKHVNALKRQGKADKTIDVYARAVRRVAQCLDCCPDRLTQEQLEAHFDALVASHSWSTVKVDRNGLQFFYEHVLKRPWTWVDIVKPPQVRCGVIDTEDPATMGGAMRTSRTRRTGVAIPLALSLAKRGFAAHTVREPCS